MNGSRQAISAPFGVTAFGSAISKVAPDVASIRCAVSRLEPKPDKAFSEARKGAQSVQECLRKSQIADFGASRITLMQKRSFFNGENKFLGYEARVSIRATIPQLDRVEQVVCDLVEAGANEIEQISFETERLKEVRSEARRLAIVAAREKAENYCRAAGVSLGPVLHIEDVNPEVPQFRGGGVAGAAAAADDDGAGRAFDPSAVQVNAAVIVAFGLVHEGT